MLAKHPEVFMATPKELSFFVAPEARRVESWAEYQLHFAAAQRARIVGEASVAYLFDPTSAAAIYERLGHNVKILIFVRNPVDMAYSLWGHMRRLEREPLDFIDAIAASERRVMGQVPIHDWIGNYQYLERAQYAPQITRYRQLFGEQQVRIEVFDDLVERPSATITRLHDWLGIAPLPVSSAPILNPAGVGRIPGLRRLMDRHSVPKQLFKSVMPKRARQKIKGFVELFNRRALLLPELPLSVRRDLEQYFLQDVQTISSWAERDLAALWGMCQPSCDDGDIG